MAKPKVWPGSGLSFRWSEYLGRGAGAPQDGAFQRDGTRQAMQMLIHWEDLELAKKELLGYSSRLVGAATKMDRLVPWNHRRATWLYCTGISGVKNIKFLGIHDGVSPEYPFPGPIAKYKWALLTLIFTSPQYKIRTNDQVTKEYERWVVKESDTTADLLTSEVGEYRYAEPPHKNKPFKNGLAQQVSKTMLRWLWVDVPANYVLDTNGIASNIEACVNKVNHAEWCGMAAGTLLMLPPKITMHGAPCDPIDMHDPVAPLAQPLTCDVSMNMVYFKRGHNYAPAPANTNNPNWYLVTHNGELDGRRLLESVDFDLAWQPVP